MLQVPLASWASQISPGHFSNDWPNVRSGTIKAIIDRIWRHEEEQKNSHGGPCWREEDTRVGATVCGGDLHCGFKYAAVNYSTARQVFGEIAQEGSRYTLALYPYKNVQ